MKTVTQLISTDRLSALFGNALSYFLGLWIMVLAAPVHAEFPKTDADFATLPPYCLARMRSEVKSPQWNAWKARLKGGFMHIHHHCAALFSVSKANMLQHPQGIHDLLVSAVKDYEYMETHSTPDFILRPQLSVEKGRVLERLGRDGEAVRAYEAAIASLPRYSPAYIALADFYADRGNKAKARATVEQGLEQKPDSKGLRRRLKELQ